ncbi:PX domain-containing protein [Xylariaceae sp. FL0016]|nr:PX domain-containing protein [Xylariaceae sp. FL0016]
MASSSAAAAALPRSRSRPRPALGDSSDRRKESPTTTAAPSMPTPQPPPSPPATETDTETDSAPGSPLRELAPRNSDEEAAEEEEDTPEAYMSRAGSPVMSPVTSPPYWLHAHTLSPTSPSRRGDHHGRHNRTVSSASLDSLPGSSLGRITLRDNEAAGSNDDRGSACWARSVSVTDYVVVNGGSSSSSRGGGGSSKAFPSVAGAAFLPGTGAFVVWNIRVETLSGSRMDIRKRYSEFDEFRDRLMRTFPGFEAAVPELPPKSLISKFRPRFLERRRGGLQYFLNCILLNPEFSGSPVLKEFLFS